MKAASWLLHKTASARICMEDAEGCQKYKVGPQQPGAAHLGLMACSTAATKAWSAEPGWEGVQEKQVPHRCLVPLALSYVQQR